MAEQPNPRSAPDFSHAASAYLERTFPDADDASMKASMLLLHLANRIQQDSEKRVHRPVGLGWTAYAALFALDVYGESQAGYLARVAGVSRQAMSKAIATLEREGLITRTNGDDRRTQAVRLTDEGRAMSVRATAGQILVSEEWFRGVDLEARAAFMTMLLQLIENRAVRRLRAAEPPASEEFSAYRAPEARA